MMWRILGGRILGGLLVILGLVAYVRRGGGA
jgi:hypothetical protein